MLNRAYLWVEENLGTEEALVADIDGELLSRDRVLALELLDPLGRVRVVLAELLRNVRANVAKLLLLCKTNWHFDNIFSTNSVGLTHKPWLLLQSPATVRAGFQLLALSEFAEWSMWYHDQRWECALYNCRWRSPRPGTQARPFTSFCILFIKSRSHPATFKRSHLRQEWREWRHLPSQWPFLSECARPRSYSSTTRREPTPPANKIK